MGLQITAYKGVKLINEPALDEYGDIVGHDAKQVTISIGNSEWEQGDDLEAGQVYTYGDAMSVFSAPYSSYGRLRNELARIAGYKKVITGNTFDDRYPYQTAVCYEWDKGERGVLAELLCFADNEGEIGTKTCRKILNDLHTVSARAGELSDDHGIGFCYLVSCFEFAVVDGFVQFS